MTTYIHQRPDWPEFRWSHRRLAEQLAAVRHRQGFLLGRMEGVGLKLRAEATLSSLTEEVVKSSEIEGEILNKDQVRSSLARRLGVDIGALKPADRQVEGVVDMMIDATREIRRAAHRRTAVRLACCAIPDWTQRHGQDRRRQVAHGSTLAPCRWCPAVPVANAFISKHPPRRGSIAR